MSWKIGVLINTLVIDEEICDEFVETADEYDQCIYINDDGEIEFDYDAREHMDFLDEDWVAALTAGTDTNGIVIFGSVEGDNAGKFWGYCFIDGNRREIHKVEALTKLLDMAKNEIA